MNITDMLKELAERIPEPEPMVWVECRPKCAECREYEVMDYDEICELCKKEWSQHYQVMSLAGRCANGSELDHGTRYHAVQFDSYRAICGAKPGRRSVGWTRENKDTTCPRCVAKLEKMTRRAKGRQNPILT